MTAKKDQQFVIVHKDTGRVWAGGDLTTVYTRDDGWTRITEDGYWLHTTKTNARQRWASTTGVSFSTKALAVMTEDEARAYQEVMTDLADVVADLNEGDEPGTEVAPYVDVETVDDEDDTIHDGELVGADDLGSLAATANRYFADFEAAGHSALVAAWNCGAALARAKELVGHGEFKPWVESNFDGSYSLASSYMRIASNVQRSELSQHDSINGVLKAIAAGKPKPARAARSMGARADAILKAAEKLAQVVHEFTLDMDAEEHDGDDFESEMNQAADAITGAFEDFDSTFNEVFA